jgi:hypothetical protein
MEEMMKRLPLTTATLFVVFLLAAVASAAPIPKGSYKRSCFNITMQGNTLLATCLTRRGTPTTTRLPFANRCRGDIANINGNLTCQ